MTKVVTVRAQQRWDYCFETCKTETYLLTTVSDRGQAGWELVDVVHHKDPKGEMCWTAFLKRPSAAQSPQPEQQVATSTKSASPGQAAESPSQPQGFDLSGEEFPVRGE